MSSLWAGKTPPDTPTSRDVSDVADTGLADVGLPAPQAPQSAAAPMGRPQLQRNQPAPPPPHQPPPPPSPNPKDSLSLMQLRRIVTEFPKVDPTTYAFTYADAASFEEELDEWFSYSNAEYKRLRWARDTFGRRWGKVSSKPWLESEDRQSFVEQQVNGLQATDLRRRCKSLQSVLHIVLGVWDETAGIKSEEGTKPKTRATPKHLDNMKDGIVMVANAGGITLVFQVLQNAFKMLWDDEFRETKLLDDDIPYIQDELDNVTTVIYMLVEWARNDPTGLASVREQLCRLYHTS